MRQLLLLFFILWLNNSLRAQYVYTINADSVKITNHCDTAELIIENHTQTVPGFLYNKGRGRTEFRRALQQLGPYTYLVGGDTLFTQTNAWLQGGNSFGATGVLGTLDNNPLDIYTNNTQQARFTATGNVLLGGTTDYDYRYKLQLMGSSGNIFFNPNLSTSGDRIVIGGAINGGDDQNNLISTSSDGGNTYTHILSERDGLIAFGNSGIPAFGWWTGSPAIRNFPDGRVGVASPAFYYGQDEGPNNASQLLTTVSNTNEWVYGPDYPNGQNYYYFGTVLGTPYAGYKRPPLRISALQLQFFTSAGEVEAARLSEAGNLLVGTVTDDGSNKLQVAGGGVRFASLNPDSNQTRVLVSDANGNLFYRNLSAWASNGTLKLKPAAWADYVFNKDYHLPPLTEIDSYIQCNNHLPGIATAAEVRRDGIEIGEAQAALLKKIEELTLYAIQQNKQLKAQNLELKKQQDEIEALKQQNNELDTIKKELAELKKYIGQ